MSVVPLDIRIAEHDDYDRIKMMWSCCFDDSAAFIDWYFDNIYLPENTLCVWEKGTLVSSMQVLPRQLFVRGAFQPTGYVVGVMTLPQYRERGYAGHLLQAAVDLMNQRGLLLSVLVSDVDPRFYQKFGWEPTHNIMETAMDTASAAALPLRPAQTAEIPLLQSFYERYCSNGRHGYFFRDSGIWRNILADLELDGGKAYLICDSDSHVGGYLLLLDENGSDAQNDMRQEPTTGCSSMLSGAMPMRPSRQVKVKEFVCLDPNGNEIGLPQIATQLIGAPALQIKTKAKPFLMTRVINLRRLLENCRAPHNYDGRQLSFEVAMDTPELMHASANTWAALILGAPDNELYRAAINRLNNPLRDQIARLFSAADNYACELF